MRRPLPGAPAVAAVTELPPGRYPEYDAATMQQVVLGDFLRTVPILPDVVDGLLVCPAGMASGAGADLRP